MFFYIFYNKQVVVWKKKKLPMCTGRWCTERLCAPALPLSVLALGCLNPLCLGWGERPINQGKHACVNMWSVFSLSPCQLLWILLLILSMFVLNSP